MRPITVIILTGLTWVILFLGRPPTLFSEGVKTHYKKYNVFTYTNADYLCEPYEVKKDDWLYKIFRKKGEISASDFPKFLKIFKKINPQLSNIDAIAPGIQIMIPLKQVDKKEYVQKQEGIVKVPVLEFSLSLGKKEVEAFIRNHMVQIGDTVSTLLGKEFLKKGGNISKIGEKTFTSLNPDIRDINRIYAGAHLLIPEPTILSQPWLDTLIEGGFKNLFQQPGALDVKPVPPPKPTSILSAGDLGRLKRYAQLIQGTLMYEGKVFFPGKNGEPTQILDLSKTPVLEEDSGQKTIVLPSNTPVASLDQDLVTAMKAYWKGLRLQELHKTLGKKPDQKQTMNERPKSLDSLIKTLVSITPFTYTAQGNFPITLKRIEMTVSIGRITHDSRSDIIVNIGSVYGQALGILKQQGYDMLTLSSKNTIEEITLLLFSKLGYETWKNPSFYAKNRVKSINGIYVSKGAQKHFITRISPSDEADTFLNNENIHLLMLEGDAGL